MNTVITVGLELKVLGAIAAIIILVAIVVGILYVLGEGMKD